MTVDTANLQLQFPKVLVLTTDFLPRCGKQLLCILLASGNGREE